MKNFLKLIDQVLSEAKTKRATEKDKARQKSITQNQIDNLVIVLDNFINDVVLPPLKKLIPDAELIRSNSLNVKNTKLYIEPDFVNTTTSIRYVLKTDDKKLKPFSIGFQLEDLKQKDTEYSVTAFALSLPTLTKVDDNYEADTVVGSLTEDKYGSDRYKIANILNIIKNKVVDTNFGLK